MMNWTNIEFSCFITSVLYVCVFELTLRVFHLSNHILGANKSTFITSRGVVVLHRGMVRDVSPVCCIPVKASCVWEKNKSCIILWMMKWTRTLLSSSSCVLFLVAVSDVTAHWYHSALHLWYMCSVCVWTNSFRVFHLSNHILGANKSMFITSRGVVVLHRGMV